MQPGETITPGDQTQPPENKSQGTSSSPPEVPLSQQEEVASSGTDASPPQETVESNWRYSGGSADDAAFNQTDPYFSSVEPVSWTASEFVSHEKSAGWYFLVIFGALLLGVVIYWLTKDIVSPVVVTVVGIAFAAFGARKPRVLNYAIDNEGVHIGARTYPYAMFRTFSVIEEDAIRSILLMPMQRFNLPISIYYEPTDEAKIIDTLGAYLPHQDRKPAPIDSFMRKIRF